MKATAGETLFRLADISVVWVLADIAETDLPLVSVGQPVTVKPRGSNRVFTGRVSVTYPAINKDTRTARLRIELPNPDSALLPDMYADVEISTGSGKPVLTVEDSALIDSGDRKVVILDKGEGRFEPRPVKTGQRGGGYVEITDGARGRRPGRRRRQFPDRCGKQSQGRPSRPDSAGRGQMIAKLIAWSGRNIMLVLIASLFAGRAGFMRCGTCRSTPSLISPTRR